MTENQDKARLPLIDHPFMTHDQARAAGQKIREDCVWPDQCHVLIADCQGRAADPLGKDYCAEPASAHKAPEPAPEPYDPSEMSPWSGNRPRPSAPEPADKAGANMAEKLWAIINEPSTGEPWAAHRAKQAKVAAFLTDLVGAAEAAARAEGARQALNEAADWYEDLGASHSSFAVAELLRMKARARGGSQ